MIQPEDIRRKAENLYRKFLLSYVEQDQDFFPLVIRARKTPDAGDLAAAIQAVRTLRAGAKETLGYGYTIEWREINSRTFGQNLFPSRILFTSREDYLRYIGKGREFAVFAQAVDQVCREHPDLQRWIGSNLALFLEAAPDLAGLLHVVRFFRDTPRPARFARELPLPMDTKFIERYQKVLRAWFDIVLPPHAIRADEQHFERRYGLKYAEPHLLVRFLDSDLQRELGFPCDELSLPLTTLGGLRPLNATVLIVENKVNLLTLPPMRRGIGLGGLGDGVTLLRHVPWLAESELIYWGDLDVEGFEALSSLRALYPHTRSLMMDEDTLRQWRHLAARGTGCQRAFVPHLSSGEHAALIHCRSDNLRIEQERIPQESVLQMLTALQVIRTP